MPSLFQLVCSYLKAAIAPEHTHLLTLTSIAKIFTFNQKDYSEMIHTHTLSKGIFKDKPNDGRLKRK